jgi:hypothetical protein
MRMLAASFVAVFPPARTHQRMLLCVYTGMFDASSFKGMKIELYTDAYLALQQGMSATPPEARL